jgi:hypothetical protein
MYFEKTKSVEEDLKKMGMRKLRQDTGLRTVDDNVGRGSPGTVMPEEEPIHCCCLYLSLYFQYY